MTELCRRLAEEKIPHQQNVLLSRCGSFRIGGRAALVICPNSCGDLISALQILSEYPIPYAVVGKGSNLLFPDAGYPGAVVFTGGCKRIECHDREIIAEAGVALATVAKRARQSSLAGAEFAAGIPGTLGGAVFMNAGAFGGCMQQLVQWSEYWDFQSSTCVRLFPEEHCFSTRYSSYMEHPERVILRAGLCLRAGDRAQIDEITESYRRRRAATQPQGLPNAGSIFRHPPNDYAGRMIEECGLKGTRIGGAEVSQKHAGFIVNVGGAREQDVLELIALIRERVFARFGVSLCCELRRLDGREI